jgi:hypothetical protein
MPLTQGRVTTVERVIRLAKARRRRYRKTDFFQAVWPLWNWNDIGARFEAARALNITLEGASR